MRRKSSRLTAFARSICAWAVSYTHLFQKVDSAPDTKTCAQGHYESLQNTNCTVEKFHKIILLKNVFDFWLSCCVNLVHIEGVRGFYHGTLLLHVPFHVKDIFRVGVGRVSVIRVPGEVVLEMCIRDRDDNRPEALLAAVCAAPAKVIVGNTVSVVEEKAPFQPPLFCLISCPLHCQTLWAVF